MGERTAGDELCDGPLAAVRGLHVVEDSTAASPVIDAGALRRVVRLGPDVEADDHARLGERFPERVPLLVVPLRPAQRRTGRQKSAQEPTFVGPLDLGHGIVDVEQGDGGHADEAR